MKKRLKKNKMKFGPNSISFLKAKFKRKHGYELNLANPRTFSEKIQWIKQYGNLERFSKYVDKYEVREYVREKIGEQYLIPLIGVFDRVDEINWDILPESFVMKANHGSGWNIIVRDKAMVNQEFAKRKMRKWLRSSFYRINGESNYRNIKPRVVIEELLKDPTGDVKDYKFFCFHGGPKFIQVTGDRSSEGKRDLYDLSWNKLPVRLGSKNFKEPIAKPASLDEMLSISRKLCSEFEFVRVDLYYTNGQIFFGELTFTPMNGMTPITPFYFDKMFGEFLDITRYI